MTMPMTLTLARRAPRTVRVFGLCLLAALLILPFLALLPADHPLAVPVWVLTLAGKILCYAIVAVALDLVWGYAGMLSLGHGIFFALGGYAMGMYLMRQASGDGLPAFTRPQSGRAIYDQSTDLTSLDPIAIARQGIGRKFQKPTVFEALTVEENLELAMKEDKSVWATLRARLSGEQRDRIDEMLGLLRLGAERGRRAGLLSHGQKQFLEIGMLLLLDEPAAGMTDAETEYTAELFRTLAGKHSLMVVEHDMGFVETIADHVTVLHQGRVLAEGSLRDVQANEQVIEVYLGR